MATTSMINTSILIGNIKEENKEQIEKISNAMAGLYKEKYPILETTLPEQIQQKIRALDNFIKKQDKYKGVVKEDYDSNTYRSAILAVRLVLNSESSAKLKEQALDLYGILRPSLEKEKVKNLPLPYPPSVVSKTYDGTIEGIVNQVSESKTKPETVERISKNLEEIQKELLNVEKEIMVLINGDKDRPGTYYISSVWGSKLESLLDKYSDLENKYKIYDNEAKEQKIEYEKKEIKPYSDFVPYSIYVENAKKVEFLLNNLKVDLKNSQLVDYNKIIDHAIKKIEPLLIGPLERKFKLNNRSYIENNSSYIENLASQYGVDSESKTAYLDLMLKLSKDKEFINSNFAKFMDGKSLLTVDFGPSMTYSDVNNSYKDISIFGKYELYKHYNGNVPTNGVEFGTLVLGMSIMGDSSGQVLNRYGSMLYGKFNFNGSLLVMQHIGAATNYAESMCDYYNLDKYIEKDIKDAFENAFNLTTHKVRKLSGEEGQENRDTVGPIDKSVTKTQSEGGANARAATGFTGKKVVLETETKTQGLTIESIPNMFKEGSYVIEDIGPLTERFIGQKSRINVNSPSPEEKVPVLTSDLSGFAYKHYRETMFDTVSAGLKEDFDYSSSKSYDPEGKKISDENTTTSKTDLSLNLSGETSSLTGTGDFSRNVTNISKEGQDKNKSESNIGGYDIRGQNVYGTSGFATGKFALLDSNQVSMELENYLNYSKELPFLKNTNTFFYLREKQVTSLDEKGQKIDKSATSTFELQCFVKTEQGWVHVGMDELDSNVESLYANTLVNIGKDSFVETGVSGLMFYGKVDKSYIDEISDRMTKNLPDPAKKIVGRAIKKELKKQDPGVKNRLKAGIELPSDFHGGEKELEFEGAGGSVQVSGYGAGGTYQKREGEDRILVFGLLKGTEAQGWGSVVIGGVPESGTSEAESLLNNKIDSKFNEKAPIVKGRQSKSEIFKEYEKTVGGRGVFMSTFGGTKLMTDAFLQVQTDSKEVYAGTVARVILNSGAFFGGAGSYNQEKDEGMGTAYWSNKERTKFITAQMIGKEMNLDAVTMGLVYQKIFGWEVDLKGFTNYKDLDNTAYGVQFDALNKSISLYAMGGETYSDLVSSTSNDKNLFVVAGGRYGTAFEAYGIFGDKDALDVGRGGFGNLQYIRLNEDNSYGLGFFGGGTEKKYGTLSSYGFYSNNDFSVLGLLTWAQSPENKNVEQLNLSTNQGNTIMSAGKGNYFEAALLGKFYLENATDISIGGDWSGQFNDDKSSAQMILFNFGLKKEVSWPYSVGLDLDFFAHWMDFAKGDASKGDKYLRTLTNLTFSLDYKNKIKGGISTGIETEKVETPSSTEEKVGVTIMLDLTGYF